MCCEACCNLRVKSNTNAIGDPGMTSYRWPDFGAVDNKPRKQQQTIQRSAIIYGLSWSVNRIYHHVYHCRCNKYWVWSWCRTCIKESFTKLVWQIKSRNCWRWAGQMSVSASGWSVHWEWEQPTEWPNLAWGDFTLDISGKYGLLWVVTGYAKTVWQEDYANSCCLNDFINIEL